MSLQVQLINQTASPILTVTHWPQTRVSKTCGVVIAPAVGAEYFRSHWAVRRLADQLSRAGFPVLRFDYQGIGDSTGDVSQVGSLATWEADLIAAANDLQVTSGCEELAVVGLRLGAAIACSAAAKIPGLKYIVGWEPVFHGPTYLSSLRRMQSQMLDLWVEPMTTITTETHEEILGTLYPRTLLQEIDQLHASPADCETIQYTKVSYDSAADEANQELGPENPAWDDLRYTEIAWLPNRGIREIVQWFSALDGQGKE